MMRPFGSELVRTGLLTLGILLLGSLLFYGPGIATGSELFFTHDGFASDLWHLHYPMKHFLADELRAGRLPLWCPYVSTGFPLHAEGQVGALYPPNLLLYALLPLPLAFNWSILLHVLLGVLSYSPQRVELDIEAPRDCWLFLSDTPYPGWEVEIDGVPARWHAANLIGRAVPVTEGRHRVVFRFKSRSFRVGLLLSAIGLAGTGLVLVPRPKSDPHRRTDERGHSQKGGRA